MKSGDMFRAVRSTALWDSSIPNKSSTIGILRIGEVGMILCVNSTYKHQGVKLISSNGKIGWGHGTDLEIIE